MNVHRYAQLVPEMTADEYAEFREDIRVRGLNQPITLFEGQILDSASWFL